MVSINFLNRSHRYFVKFVRKTSLGYERAKQKEVKITDKVVQFGKNQSYPLDFEKISFTEKNKSYMFINIDGGQISLGENTITTNVGIVDLILNTKVIRDLAQRLQPNNNSYTILMALVFIFMGIAVGYIIGNIADIEAIKYALTHIQLPHL